MMRKGWAALLLAGLVAGCGDKMTEPISNPSITAVAPAEGTAGTEIRIDGTGFRSDATVQVGSASSPAVAMEGGSLFALAPAGITAGTAYDVVVRNPDGGTATHSASFTAVPPRAARVNGVSKPTGLQGMTIIIEGSAFGDEPVLSQGRVFFQDEDGTSHPAVVMDPEDDWTDSFIVTAVPQGVASTSYIFVETATGLSEPIEFQLIQSGTFSPSVINWTITTPLPQPLQGLGAVFAPVEEGPSPANYVFTVGGADSVNVATDAVYRAEIQDNGSLDGAWDALASLPAPRAYHATAAATGYTAALDTTTTAAYLYVIGGQDEDGQTVASVFVGHVDLEANVTGWSQTQALPQPLHGARAVVFRGFVYVTGGATADAGAVATLYRAQVNADGSLGAWTELDDMPVPTAFHSMASFGPFLYVLGGDSTAVDPVRATQSSGEIQSTFVARVSLRTGDLTLAGWTATNAPPKARSKHSTVFAGGYLFHTSGIYPGFPGSSENMYGNVLSDGTVESWNGATGVNTIKNRLGYDLYNQAAVSFIDASGQGRVMVLGGAKRASEGEASAAVVYY